MVLAYQTSGEFLRWNPPFHCLVLEGGFDERCRFVHIPLGDIQRMSEYFRRVVIRLSVDHSMGVPAFSIRARQALCAVSDKESRSKWARLIAQVYEVDPLTC